MERGPYDMFFVLSSVYARRQLDDCCCLVFIEKKRNWESRSPKGTTHALHELLVSYLSFKWCALFTVRSLFYQICLKISHYWLKTGTIAAIFISNVNRKVGGNNMNEIRDTTMMLCVREYTSVSISTPEIGYCTLSRAPTHYIRGSRRERGRCERGDGPTSPFYASIATPERFASALDGRHLSRSRSMDRNKPRSYFTPAITIKLAIYASLYEI